MSHFGDWFNYEATLKILLFSMLAGAALPGLFAVGIRLQAIGAGGRRRRRHRLRRRTRCSPDWPG